MNLIETSFNVPQTQSRTLRPTYMDKNGTWKTVVVFLSREALHYIWVRVLCFYYAFSVGCKDGHVCRAVCQFQMKNTRPDFDEMFMFVMLLTVTLNSWPRGAPIKIPYFVRQFFRPYAWNNSREPLNRILWTFTLEKFTNYDYCRVSLIFIQKG
jgi:hypothetical protein